MDNYKDIQQLLENLEREIKDLKCSHSIVGDVKMFVSSFIPDNSSPYVVVNYDEGDNDIISDFYGTIMTASKIINNSQKVFLPQNEAHYEVIVCSTRPILSISQ